MATAPSKADDRRAAKQNGSADQQTPRGRAGERPKHPPWMGKPLMGGAALAALASTTVIVGEELVWIEQVEVCAGHP